MHNPVPDGGSSSAAQGSAPTGLASELYLVARKGIQQGPFTLDHIRQSVASGVFAASDFAWTQGMPNWQTLSEVLASHPAPPAPATSPGQAGPPLYCAQCGEKNGQNDYRCARCGALLHPAPRPVSTGGDPFQALIPYKNAQALWAYYLGVFSLITVLGAPLALAALVLGIRGLAHFKSHPEAGGRAHALTGVIIGSVVLLGHAFLILLMVIRANS